MRCTEHIHNELLVNAGGRNGGLLEQLRRFEGLSHIVSVQFYYLNWAILYVR